ncbi:dipeptidase PepV [Ligilactobacillus cholophilus]|uniref:dipeptidase PepV n=1 Tax=Ligilactobacillus cholophilus TaxID=3050131 RepID=UPI0025B00176|nr:dipeptidase PepV [Ligilactobacillus cholophilus]
MTIDWKKEAENRREELLEDLKSMLRIKSVRDESKKTDDAPLGPGPKAGLDQFLSIANRDGFKTTNIDGMAGEISFGQGDETLGILAHVDVMPAGKGWNTDPFEPVIKDGKIYARGASDDKGPSMAAYYGLKIIKDLNLPVSKKVAFILGTDEESSWRGMDYYFKNMPEPDFGFSPDAFFPIINGEKGNVTFDAKFNGTNDGNYSLIKFDSGLRENMVPRDAEAWIESKNGNYDEMIKKFDEFVAENPIVGESDIQDGKLYIHVIGKAAHAQEPKRGINAGTYMCLFLNQFDFGAGAKNFISFAAEKLHLDSRLNNFDMAYTDEVMGDLTMNAGIFSFDENNGGSITLNFRYPQGTDPEYIANGLNSTKEQYDAKFVQHEGGMVPHYVPEDDPLVKTLLNVYRDQTGEDAHGQVVGGGTYGRLMKRGVAFGAMFPGVPDTMHQANEFVPVDDLIKAAAIYAQGIYELIK